MIAIIAMAAISFLVTPPILWFLLYRSVIAQEDPNDFNPQMLYDKNDMPYLQYRWLTKREAQREILKSTLKHPFTYVWGVYAIAAIVAIIICATG